MIESLLNIEDWLDLLLDNEAEYINFYKNILIKSQQPILELNAGTGKLNIELLKENLDIDYHDENINFIQKFTEKLERNNLSSKIYNQKLQFLSLPKNYNTVFAGGNSFLLIDNEDDALNVLKKIYQYLNNGGRFIVDIYIPWQQILSDNKKLWKTGNIIENKETSEKLIIYFSEDIDLHKQIRIINSKYELYKNNCLQNTFFETTKVKWYSINEFKYMLEKTGFSKIEIYNQKIYNHQESSTVFIASKLE